MARAPDTQASEAPWVVYRIEPKVSGLWAVHVQMPNGDTAIVVVPGVGLSFTKIRLATMVVAQLWETRRGATPVGGDT